jgi:hypothetical protein
MPLTDASLPTQCQRPRANGVAQWHCMWELRQSLHLLQAQAGPAPTPACISPENGCSDQSSFSCPSGAPTGLPLGSQWGSNPEPLIKYLPSPGLVNAGGLPRLPSQARITQVRYLNKDTVLYYLLRSSRLRRNKFDEVSRHPDVNPYYFPASPDGRE